MFQVFQDCSRDSYSDLPQFLKLRDQKIDKQQFPWNLVGGVKLLSHSDIQWYRDTEWDMEQSLWNNGAGRITIFMSILDFWMKK